MIPTNNNIIIGYTNNFLNNGIIKTSTIQDQNKNENIIDNDTVIQLKAYETKLITVKLNNMTLETYNSLKDLDIKIRIEFINGLYQVIPISIQ